ncbi:MAG: 4Fe-4S binding protein [Verrucomicrobiae bacterium]|nr:4Fe-4S binding protein [Verrucomicrobiae bacterium]
MIDASPSRRSRVRRWSLHAYRVGLFVVLLFLIHRQHAWYVAQKRGAMKQLVGVEEVRGFYPKATSLSEWVPAHGGQNVFDANGEVLGHVIQTSPEADDIIGFSGPTNTLIAFDTEDRILGIDVLRSDDTREHLKRVLSDEAYLAQWNGLVENEVIAGSELDAVSGATLTSTAIADGIATRLGGRIAETDRFPDEITVDEIQPFLAGADALQLLEKRPHLLQVLDASGQLIGYASRTSPFADHMMGYQGPTDVLLVLDPDERLLGCAIRSTYDNQPYVSYLTEDEYFFNTFKGFDLGEISQIDMVEMGIAEVSSATKTSITVAESLIETAVELTKVREPAPPKPLVDLSVRAVGTSLVVLAGLIIAFTRLRGNRKLRLAFQVVLVVYLGFINADMLSQALLVGWTQNGVPWKAAPGLVLLTAAALIAPIFTGRQVYCTHLCPYGAAQDWLSRRLPWQAPVKGKLDAVLSAVPILLLLVVVVVAMGHFHFSLVGIEPFDAFVFRIAGWAAIGIAIAGLIASLFVTRAYCRYGCPTGAMLKFLRLGAASDRFGRRDLVAAALVLIALGMTWLR